jgi:pimeloyl-ACP methyl ester carboxylesterase
VAQELAVTAPGRVERLVLLCTSPGGAGGSSYPLHELDGLPSEQLAELRKTLLDSRFDEAWLEGHPGDRRLLEMMTSADAVEEPSVTAGRRAQMAARRGHDVWDRLGAITCPTFVGCGRYDPIAPLVNSEAIVSRVRNAELHVYEGGHPFFVQDPKALPEIREFLLGPGR